MSDSPSGKDLFIVDNSISGWTGLRYLEEWTEIAKSFDIATGYFEIGSLLALDSKWQDLEKTRILMGAETTYRTRKALLEAVKARAEEHLDQSLEDEKKENPFLHGVPAVLRWHLAGPGGIVEGINPKFPQKEQKENQVHHRGASMASRKGRSALFAIRRNLNPGTGKIKPNRYVQ